MKEVDHDPTGHLATKILQTLTFYELDLGLNHVVRKYAEPLVDKGNILISGMSIQSRLIKNHESHSAAYMKYVNWFFFLQYLVDKMDLVVLLFVARITLFIKIWVTNQTSNVQYHEEEFVYFFDFLFHLLPIFLWTVMWEVMF